MKKTIIFTIIALFSAMFVGAQTTKVFEPTWQIINEEILPDTCTFYEGLTKNGNPKVHTFINNKKVSINYNSYTKYINKEIKLILITSKKDNEIKYNIKQISKADMQKDLQTLSIEFEKFVDIIYEINPNIGLDILSETDEYELIQMILKKYEK
jgi:hypothetical protein